MMSENSHDLKKNNLAERITAIKERCTLPLPGSDSHWQMAPAVRKTTLHTTPPSDAIVSSVLILLYPWNQQLFTVVMQRPEYEGVHSGQISLPGGKSEQGDESLEATALRETQEEMGIDISKIHILGTLSPLYIPPSNYIVYPYIGFSEERPRFIADPIEVKEIIEFNIEDILKPENIVQKQLQFRNDFTMDVPGYRIGNHFIWGATAMIFSEMAEILRQIGN